MVNLQGLWKADLPEGNPGNIGDDSGRKLLGLKHDKGAPIGRNQTQTQENIS
jgi:hypothetical protein